MTTQQLAHTRPPSDLIRKLSILPHENVRDYLLDLFTPNIHGSVDTVLAWIANCYENWLRAAVTHELVQTRRSGEESTTAAIVGGSVLAEIAPTLGSFVPSNVAIQDISPKLATIMRRDKLGQIINASPGVAEILIQNGNLYIALVTSLHVAAGTVRRGVVGSTLSELLRASPDLALGCALLLYTYSTVDSLAFSEYCAMVVDVLRPNDLYVNPVVAEALAYCVLPSLQTHAANADADAAEVAKMFVDFFVPPLFPHQTNRSVTTNDDVGLVSDQRTSLHWLRTHMGVCLHRTWAKMLDRNAPTEPHLTQLFADLENIFVYQDASMTYGKAAPKPNVPKLREHGRHLCVLAAIVMDYQHNEHSVYAEIMTQLAANMLDLYVYATVTCELDSVSASGVSMDMCTLGLMAMLHSPQSLSREYRARLASDAHLAATVCIQEAEFLSDTALERIPDANMRDFLNILRPMVRAQMESDVRGLKACFQSAIGPLAGTSTVAMQCAGRVTASCLAMVVLQRLDARYSGLALSPESRALSSAPASVQDIAQYTTSAVRSLQIDDSGTMGMLDALGGDGGGGKDADEEKHLAAMKTWLVSTPATSSDNAHVWQRRLLAIHAVHNLPDATYYTRALCPSRLANSTIDLLCWCTSFFSLMTCISGVYVPFILNERSSHAVELLRKNRQDALAANLDSSLERAGGVAPESLDAELERARHLGAAGSVLNIGLDDVSLGADILELVSSLYSLRQFWWTMLNNTLAAPPTSTAQLDMDAALDHMCTSSIAENLQPSVPLVPAPEEPPSPSPSPRPPTSASPQPASGSAPMSSTADDDGDKAYMRTSDVHAAIRTGSVHTHLLIVVQANRPARLLTRDEHDITLLYASRDVSEAATVFGVVVTLDMQDGEESSDETRARIGEAYDILLEAQQASIPRTYFNVHIVGLLPPGTPDGARIYGELNEGMRSASETAHVETWTSSFVSTPWAYAESRHTNSGQEAVLCALHIARRDHPHHPQWVLDHAVRTADLSRELDAPAYLDIAQRILYLVAVSLQWTPPRLQSNEKRLAAYIDSTTNMDAVDMGELETMRAVVIEDHSLNDVCAVLDMVRSTNNSEPGSWAICAYTDMESMHAVGEMYTEPPPGDFTHGELVRRLFAQEGPAICIANYIAAAPKRVCVCCDDVRVVRPLFELETM